jgi:hypothetical protein
VDWGCGIINLQGGTGWKLVKEQETKGIEMENITKKVDDSFECSKKMAAANKSQKKKL